MFETGGWSNVAEFVIMLICGLAVATQVISIALRFMKQCTSCGKRSPKNARFCQQCGNNFSGKIAVDTTPPDNSRSAPDGD